MSSGELPSRILAALATLSEWLDAEKIPHTIIGGIAVSLLTEPRATQDIDATIWCEDVSIKDLLASAASVGLVSRIDNPIEFATEARILLLRHQDSDVGIDLSLGALPFEKEMIEQAETITVGPLSLRIARPEDLIISKAVPMRPQDLADIDKLLTFYPSVDFKRIRDVVGEFQLLLDRPEYIIELEKLLQRHSAKQTTREIERRMTDQTTQYRSGYVALVGRPNAGKSTLLNALVGQKIAAVSDKPQTTRFRIQGVITKPEGQIVLVDTPGVHKPGYEMNRRMMATVQDALMGVDLVCLIRDASSSSGAGDKFVLELIQRSSKPAILLLNKIDKLKDKAALLPLIDWYRNEYEWREIVPISALRGDVNDILPGEMIKHLPEGEPLFGEDDLTDQSVRTMVAEIVREKILLQTQEEIPYVTAVVVEKWEDEREDFTRIHCAILVERSSQKKIVIGKGAARLKEIGINAREDIEHLLGHRVHLELFVKVEEEWRNKQGLLDDMGIRG